jgi:hypothetical protein
VIKDFHQDRDENDGGHHPKKEDEILTKDFLHLGISGQRAKNELSAFVRKLKQFLYNLPQGREDRFPHRGFEDENGQ